MSLQACADLLSRGDPDRFAAVMAAPVAARPVLLPLFAFNLEVARAPWVSEEGLIAEMRLQWWVDALDEIAAGGVIRRHEVVTPLAEVLSPDLARTLQRNPEARRRDAHRRPMGTVLELETYLRDTAGVLMWVAARSLSEKVDEPRAMAVGTASGLANYLLAVPEFLARGQNPLPDMSEAEFAELLQSHLASVKGRAPDHAARVAEVQAWRARGILKRALADPAAIATGGLGEAPIRRQVSLLWARRGL